MMIAIEIFTAFVLGGSAYGALEILWRGHTHWTMLLAGGISYVCIYLIASRGHENRFLQYILCAVVITTIEFVTGTIVNKILGWGVWDYSNRRWNLCGQICARYCLYWLLLSVPCCGLARLIYRYIFHGSG